MTPCQWCCSWTRVKANVWTWTVLAAKRYRWKKVYHFFFLWCGSLCLILCFRGFQLCELVNFRCVQKHHPLLTSASFCSVQPSPSCRISFCFEAPDWLVSGDHRPAVEFPAKHHIYLFAGCRLLTVIRRPLLWDWGVTFLLLPCMELKRLQMIHTHANSQCNSKQDANESYAAD